MLSLDVIFNLCSAKECLRAIIETYLFYDKGIWIAVTDCYYVLLLNCAVSIGSYNLQTFSLLNVIFSTNIIWTFT